jgi:hypothetical protein
MRKASSQPTSELFRMGVLPVENTNIGLPPTNVFKVLTPANRTAMGDSSHLAANYRLDGNVIRISPHGGRVS